MKLTYLLIIFIFLSIIETSFSQVKENQAKYSLPILQFEPDYRLNIKNEDIKYFELNNKYIEYTNKLNPEAKTLDLNPQIINILKANNARIFPVFENNNIDLLLGRIPTGVSCPSLSFLNDFKICILDINGNPDCCNIEKIDEVVSQLNSIDLPELKITRTKIDLNKNDIILDKSEYKYDKGSLQKYSKNKNIRKSKLNIDSIYVKPLVQTKCNCSKYSSILKLQNLRNQVGGFGENAFFTLVESQNVNNTNFSCCSNPDLKRTSTFESISAGISEHTLKDIAILFGDYTTSNCQNYGVSPNCHISKIILSGTQNCTNSEYGIVNAVMKAVAQTPEYGVLLIEIGSGGANKPAEYIKPIYDLIKLATSCLNITVIEPAGNAGSHLEEDNFYRIDTSRRTEKWEAEITDSGAIMVGGADKNYNNSLNTYYPSKNLHSNFGNRVDCYGVGEYVCTYYGSHNATSAASAMIAGMVVDIQSIAFNKGRYLSPKEMRELFRKPTRRLVQMPITEIENRYMPTGDILLQNLDCLLGVNNNCPPCCIEAK